MNQSMLHCTFQTYFQIPITKIDISIEFSQYTVIVSIPSKNVYITH